ncbi:MAG: hypothetical protein OXF01_12080 [Gemmatimonadetes bacterium]|nr:hypothetical protein [Gemmatimonadota bacterium]
MTDLPTRIPESQVSLVLQRAAEIDAAGGSLSIEELRRIAVEAGIGEEATDDALRELFGQGSGLQPAMAGSAGIPTSVATHPSPGRIVAGGAVGLATGFLIGLGNILTPLTSPNLLGLGAFCGTIGYLLWRAIQSMQQKDQLGFQMQNLALWFGTAVGLAFTFPILGDDAIGMAVFIWLIAAVVGGLIIKFGPREEESEQEQRGRKPVSVLSPAPADKRPGP